MRGWVIQAALLAAGAVLVCCCLIGVRSAAKADCGTHMFETVTVPALKQADAAYGTPQYVMHVGSFTSSEPLVGYYFPPFPKPCSDEPPLRNNVAVTLTRLWAGAIRAGAYVAGYKLVAAGKTNAPPSCYDEIKAGTRYRVAQEITSTGLASFDNQHPESNPGTIALVQAMKKNPYYSHIVALWTSAMSALGMPVVSFTNVKIEYSEGFGKALSAVHDHLPNGLYCQGANAYVLTAPPTAPPDAPK